MAELKYFEDCMSAGSAVFTIIAKNYLPYARVLMHSIAEHHPEWQRFVILVDHVDGCFNPEAESFEIVPSRTLPIPQIRWFQFKYSVLELSTAVKPYAFKYLFNTYTFDQIVYLDPDIRVYSPLKRVVEALGSANIVLTPHLTRSLKDDKHPTEINILQSGAYNLGFIGIAKSRDTDLFLTWWQDKLYDHCVVDLARGLFVDQKWIDLVPGMFDGVAVVRDAGYNVAYWNLCHRPISHSSVGYEVEGSPLSFFHFSGYDANQPEVLSRHQDRHQIRNLPEATQEIFRSYRDELLSAGYSICQQWPYTFATFQNGIRIPDMCRPSHHEAPELVSKIEDPFSDQGFSAFLKLWNSPIQEQHLGISRLAYRVYSTRQDVQSEMPDIFGINYKRFLEWMLSSGKVEHGLDKVFVSAISDVVAANKSHENDSGETQMAAIGTFDQDTLSNEYLEGPIVLQDGVPVRLTRLAAAIHQSRPDLQVYFPNPYGPDAVRFLLWLLTYGKKEHSLSAQQLAPLKKQWKMIVSSLPSVSAKLWHTIALRKKAVSVLVRTALKRLPLEREISRRPLFQRFKPGLKDNYVARHTTEPVKPQTFGVNLVGYFRTETGVGQSARSCYEALKAVSVPTSLVCTNDMSSSRKQDHSVGPMSSEFPYAVNLFYVNADQTTIVKQSLGEECYRNRRNIGYWAWELEEFPDRWMNAFSAYQEVWTPSQFCCNAIHRKASIPVFRIPHAVAPPIPTGMGREYFGLAPDRFIFLNAFDVLSVMERKNPLAAIRAFRMAFGSDSRCQLVLKINNAAASPKYVEILKEACYSSNAVRIIPSTLSREEMYALSQCADCAVSLHRSEGFGLFIAEAMYFSKPVIVTNYSGNVDFTRPDNALLVDYKMIHVGRNCEPYAPGSLWADPSVEQAAKHMRTVVENADLRAELSSAGSKFIRSAFSVEAVGQMMRQRLNAFQPAHSPAVMAYAAANASGR